MRVQAQPTRSREQNRKAARRILAEKLDMMVATGLWSREQPATRAGETDGGRFAPKATTVAVVEAENNVTRERDRLPAEVGQTAAERANEAPSPRGPKQARKAEKKAAELHLAGQWSRQEIQWEKERRRKVNRSKKVKKKKRANQQGGEDPDTEGDGAEVSEQGSRPPA